MARKTIYISDLTGNPIDDNNDGTWQLTDANSTYQFGIDVNADEVADLAAKGSKQARRGRKPKAS